MPELTERKPSQAETAALLTVRRAEGGGTEDTPVLGMILIKSLVISWGMGEHSLLFFKNIAFKFLLIANSFD